MSSPAFESFLARLYTDATFRAHFLAAPVEVASTTGLSAREVADLVAIDREGLRMTALSLATKRAPKPAACRD